MSRNSRPRAVFVAIAKQYAGGFSWPGEDDYVDPPTVGQALRREMGSGGWNGAKQWAEGANAIAPTLVGGSKKHGAAPTLDRHRPAHNGPGSESTASSSHSTLPQQAGTETRRS